MVGPIGGITVVGQLEQSVGYCMSRAGSVRTAIDTTNAATKNIPNCADYMRYGVELLSGNAGQVQSQIEQTVAALQDVPSVQEYLGNMLNMLG